MMRTPFMRVLRACRQIITRARVDRRRPSARGGHDQRYAGGVSSQRGMLVAVLLAAIGLPLATAGAQRAPTVQQSRHLWATVNVCDPADPPADIGPDTIGIRASMPGARDGRERMYMRFRVQ